MVPACVNNYKSKKATSLWRLFVNRIAGSEQTVRGSGHCNNVKGKLRSHNKQLVPERFALAELSCFHFSPSVVVFTFRDKVQHGFQWQMKTRANKHTLTYREMFLLMGRFYVSFLFFIPFTTICICLASCVQWLPTYYVYDGFNKQALVFVQKHLNAARERWAGLF